MFSHETTSPRVRVYYFNSPAAARSFARMFDGKVMERAHRRIVLL